MILSLLALIPAATISIVPQPQSVRPGIGVFDIKASTVLVAPGQAKKVAERFRDDIAPATGFKLRVEDTGGDRNTVRFTLTDEASYGDEGYRLVVGDKRVDITARKPAGLFYACQSLRQMMSPKVFAKSKQGALWLVPCAEIVDSPRFVWRGLHLDVSRHFYGPAFVKEFIDWLAIHKMNTFHWHLTDDGGWRIEIKKYPKLTEVGAWREEQSAEWDYANLHFPGKDSGKKTYGGYYTQKEIRDIVKYAADRFITIVPEIEMPGHSTEAIASYPELACNTPADVMAAYVKGTGNDYPSMVCAGKEEVSTFFQNVLTEVLDLFPSKFIHIGADEVPKSLWSQCADCQARMAKDNLKSVEELQSDFVQRMERWLSAHGRRLIGWDEILEGGLAPGATVMSWRGIDGGIAAAQAGHDVVMSPTSHCYFDFSYNSIPTRAVYEYEPVPSVLTPEEGQHVLGAQANIWTEWLSSEEEIETQAFPRAAALAETVWTKPENKSWSNFSAKLEEHYARMEELGIAFYLEPPQPKSELVVLGTDAKVDFEPCRVPGGVIRYTTDGSEPEATSPVFDRSFVPEAPTVVKAAVFRPKGPKSAVVEVSAIKVEVGAVDGLQPGLVRRWIKDAYSKCPDWSAFSGAESQVVDTIGVDDLAANPTFAVAYEGYLRIPTVGEYTFALGSDDGSKLWIGDGVAINHDGPHGYSEKKVSIKLPAGDLPIRIVMFEQGGSEKLTLTVAGPGSDAQPVPASMMFHR